MNERVCITALIDLALGVCDRYGIGRGSASNGPTDNFSALAIGRARRNSPMLESPVASDLEPEWVKCAAS